MPLPEGIAAGLRRAISEVCPRLRAILDERGGWTVGAFAERLWSPPTAIEAAECRRARDHVLAGLLTRIPQEDAGAAGLAEQFERHPVVQTGDHAQLLLDPLTFASNLSFYIGARRLGLKHLVVNGASTNTLEGKGGRGPGIVLLSGLRYSLFGLSREALRRTSLCGLGDVRFEWRPFASNRRARKEDLAQLARLKAVLGNARYSTGSEAVSDGNAQLWRAWTSGGAARLHYTDDALCAEILARHVAEDGIVHRLLFDTTARRHLQTEVRRATDALDLPFSLYNTDQFWGVREGRIRRLRLHADELVEVDCPATGDGLRLRWQADEIGAALRQGRLVPGLLWSSLVLAALPKIKVLGGSSQLIYMQVVRKAVTSVAAQLFPGRRSLLVDLSAAEDDWITGLIEAPDDLSWWLAKTRPGHELDDLASRFEVTRVRDSVGALGISGYLEAWLRHRAGRFPAGSSGGTERTS